MAKNTGKGHRQGAVKKRSQFLNSANNNYMKRDDKGRFMSGKKESPYKGVRLEKAENEVKLGKVKNPKPKTKKK